MDAETIYYMIADFLEERGLQCEGDTTQEHMRDLSIALAEENIDYPL